MNPPRRARAVKRLPQVLFSTAAFLAALFGGAGTFAWERGWIFVCLYMAGMASAAVVLRRLNPELLEARANWRRNKGTKLFDKVFMWLFFPLTLIQPAVAGMDAVRFRWSPLPVWLIYPGSAVFIAACAMVSWTFGVNRHAETTVRSESERGHTVVSTGPYRMVRHPMYVGLIGMYLSKPLILGSAWSLVPGAAIVLVVVWRTAMEDRTLRRELAGYEEFAARTRYRLLPGVW
jgi:protein-S-isoprenylcysteine O-methyltransferase Ste14